MPGKCPLCGAVLSLELSNLGRCAVKLYPGMRISQVVFHTMTSAAERPYGAARGSKYQQQEGEWQEPEQVGVRATRATGEHVDVAGACLEAPWPGA